MFGQKSEDDVQLDEARIVLLRGMKAHGPDDEEYETYLRYLERLTKLKTKTRRKPVSSDAVLMAGATFLNVLVVVIYEQKHVLTSKALTLFQKK